MKQYIAVCEHLWNRFNDEVNRLLQEGWELYGSPTTGACGDSGDISFCFIQAMTKNIKNTID